MEIVCEKEADSTLFLPPLFTPHHQHYHHRGKDSELTATHVGSPRLLLLLSVPRAKRTQPFRRIENCAHSRVNEIQAESPHSRGRGTLLLSIDGLGALEPSQQYEDQQDDDHDASPPEG